MNNEEKLICKICNEKFFDLHSIYLHIRFDHNLISKKYYDFYFKKENQGKCLNCNKETKFKNLRDGYYIFCCKGCTSKYNGTKIKSINTCLKKYGVKNISQSKEIIKKVKETWLKKSEYELKEIQNKRNQTNKEENIKNSNRFKEIQKKYKKTCLKNFGVLNSMQCKEIRNKGIETNLKNFGVSYPAQCKKIKEKKKITFKKHYGIDNIFKDVGYIKECTFKKLGFDNYSKTLQGLQFHREDNIKRIETQKLNGEPLTPCIGKDERIVLNEIEKYSPVKFLRNPKRFGYFPDGLIEMNNLKIDIEYDENNHKYQKDHDQIRDECFINHGYKVFRIKETEWKNNKQIIIENFKNLILEEKI